MSGFPVLFSTARSETNVLWRILLILTGLLIFWLIFIILYYVTERVLRPSTEQVPRESEESASWKALRWNDLAASAGIVATLSTLTLAIAADFQSDETATNMAYVVGTAAGAMAIASGISWFVGNRYTHTALRRHNHNGHS